MIPSYRPWTSAEGEASSIQSHANAGTPEVRHGGLEVLGEGLGVSWRSDEHVGSQQQGQWLELMAIRSLSRQDPRLVSSSLASSQPNVVQGRVCLLLQILVNSPTRPAIRKRTGLTPCQQCRDGLNSKYGETPQKYTLNTSTKSRSHY